MSPSSELDLLLEVFRGTQVEILGCVREHAMKDTLHWQREELRYIHIDE